MKMLLMAFCAALFFGVCAEQGLAWKPYMHNATADQAYNDVVADGKVTIAGQEVSVRPEIVAALQAHPAYYNAGVVGPDGFPDLTFGQAVIHPVETGKWVRHILTKAWEAQTDPRYDATERSRILAFAYGYATHASGDMWGHTLINDFALGVFPSVTDILTNVDDAEIAIRHLIIEGYIGDATPGWDGNQNRTQVLNAVNEDGDPDFSDDSTPGRAYGAPRDFIYDTLVNPDNPLPVGVCGDGIDDDNDGTADDGCPGHHFVVGGKAEPIRGPLIDFFINMKAGLQVKKAQFDFDLTHIDCNPLDLLCIKKIETIDVDTVRGKATTEVTFFQCVIILCPLGPDPRDLSPFVGLADLYVNNWIDDVDTALRHWSDLGLATTQALFDPQAHRDAQNFKCRNFGGEQSPARIACEEEVGTVDTVLFKSTPFVHDYLASALGAPDVFGDFLDLADSFSEFFDDLFGPELNPIRDLKEKVENFVKDKIEDAIEDELRVDLEQLHSFLTSPTHWLDVQSVEMKLPGNGTVKVDLFQPGTHERLDDLMGLDGDHHVTRTIFIPGFGNVPSTALADDAEWDPQHFAAAIDTVQQSKLALLDGAGLNDLTEGILKATGRINASATVSTYPETGTPTNVMFQQLSGDKPWLRSIDSDHSFRVDGKPRFCTEGTADCPAGEVGPPTARPEKLNAGEGTYPLWESCILRPAFRTIYTDWENGAENFPDLGDAPSADPSDPDAPTATLALAGTTFTGANGTVFVAANHMFTLTGSDATFADGDLGLQYRTYKQGTAPGPFQSVANGGTFSIPAAGGDGAYIVEYRAEDPCHTFAENDKLDPGVTHSDVFVLDTTPPTITVTSPAPEGVGFDTDDFSSIGFAVTDDGSGVNVSTVAATFDGAAASEGQKLDMFLLFPGSHSVVVSAADNLGNAGSSARRFEVHATSESLLSNTTRACNEGLIQSEICKPLTVEISQAKAKHDAGDHPVEQKLVASWRDDIDGQAGKKVDAATATRFIAYANDLIARNG